LPRALGCGDVHPLTGPHRDQVGFELGDHREDVEQQPAYGVVGVMEGAAEAEFDAAVGEFVDDGAGVGQRAASRSSVVTTSVSLSR